MDLEHYELRAQLARPAAGRSAAPRTHVRCRRPAAEERSESERRIAALAADGRSNKEIAAALCLSVRTVETHLSHIYRKLRVRSRTEVAGHSFRASLNRPQARGICHRPATQQCRFER